MSQHDFNITQADADSGVDYRAAVNNALQALGSLSSGATAPTTTYAYQPWLDTVNNTLKQRNASNSAWSEFYTVSLAGWCWKGSGSSTYNTAMGMLGLFLNTTGSGNTTVGYYSLASNTTGNYNCSFGTESLRLNSTGSANSAFGYYALKAVTTTSSNSAFGQNALEKTTANFNSGFGAFALNGCTTGNANSAFGSSAGYNITTGTNNSFLGLYAGRNASQKVDAQNSTAIGANSYTTKDNQVVLGDSNIIETLIGGVLRKRALDTAPTSSSATGTTGEVRWHANYMYVCVATNTWKRSALSTW